MNARCGWMLAIPAAALLTGAAWIPPLTTPEEVGVPPEECVEVLTEFQVLQRQIVDLDDALAKRLDAMHVAPETQRVKAIEELVEELVIQRGDERQLMKCAHQKLFTHLLEHVVTAPDQLEACPLMNAMKQDVTPGTGSPMAGPMDY